MMQLWPWFSSVQKAGTCERFCFTFRESVSPIFFFFHSLRLASLLCVGKIGEAAEMDWIGLRKENFLQDK